VGRLNLTAMVYGSLGREREATFTGEPARVQGWFAASELSFDSDWRRWRLSLLHSSGDRDPFDSRAQGFDNLTATPVFAGADSSYFLHQRLALAGGAFDLKARDAMLPALRPVAAGGQANFTNPGLDLAGLGLDCDLSPRWRLSIDANQLWLDEPAIVGVLSGGARVPSRLGAEFAVNSYWRPLMNQNVIVRVSAAWLLRGPGYRALYDGGDPYSVFAQLVLSY
jgi:hypothetical protein